MTKLISTELGPNYEFDDAVVAKLSLFGLQNFQKAQHNSFNWFRKYLNLSKNHPLYFTDNGRTSLYLLLKSLDLEIGSQVLIQGFSCVVLPNSVWGSHLQPILVDCNSTDFNFDIPDLEKKITKKTKAIIVQYTFGVVPNMDKLIDFCQQNNLILIEDVAHSLGVKASYKGNLYNVGTLGQAAFFSFGRDKIISTTRGGFAVINPNPVFHSVVDTDAWSKNLESNYQQLPNINFKSLLQTLSYPILTSIFIRPFYHLYIGKIILYFSRKVGLIGNIYTKAETVGTDKIETASKYPTRLFGLLWNQLKKIDKFNQHRIKICQIYSQKLDLPNYNQQPLLRFPVDLKTLYGDKYQAKYTQAIQQLRQHGVLVGQWYTSLFMQPNMDYQAKFDITEKELPEAFSLSNKRVINLPTNIYVTPKDAELICRILNTLKTD